MCPASAACAARRRFPQRFSSANSNARNRLIPMKAGDKHLEAGTGDQVRIPVDPVEPFEAINRVVNPLGNTDETDMLPSSTSETAFRAVEENSDDV